MQQQQQQLYQQYVQQQEMQQQEMQQQLNSPQSHRFLPQQVQQQLNEAILQQQEVQQQQQQLFQFQETHDQGYMEHTAEMQQVQQHQEVQSQEGLTEVKEEYEAWKPDLNFPPSWYDGTIATWPIYFDFFFPCCFFTETAFLITKTYTVEHHDRRKTGHCYQTELGIGIIMAAPRNLPTSGEGGDDSDLCGAWRKKKEFTTEKTV